MKKFVSVILTVLLVITHTAFASQSDKMADVLKIVKERLDITDNSDKFDDFKSSAYENEADTVYSFVWSNTETNESLEVSANADGIITSYYYYIPEYSQNEKPAFSDVLSEKAENTAKEFIKKINPDIFSRIVFSKKEDIESTYNRSFSFDFYITENGYKITAFNGYISLNSHADRVTSFHMNYIGDINYKSSDGILTKEAAMSNYAEKLGLQLVYKMYKDQKNIKIYPAYIEKNSSEKYIDAFTGEIYTPLAEDVYPLNAKAMNASGSGAYSVQEAAMDRAAFSEIELKELDKVSELFTKENAEKTVRENKIINIGNELDLESINLSADYTEEEKYIYSLVFKNTAEKDTSAKQLTTLRVTLDAQNGNICSFHKYYINSENNSGKKLSADKAKETADNALSVLGTEHKADFKLSSDIENSPYYYTYTREVNGIPFISNTANVSIDEYSGEVLSWTVSDYDIDFPSLDNVISADDAIKMLFEQVSYEPAYLILNDGKDYYSALVYTISDNYSINLNAVTGKLSNYKGEDINLQSTAVTYSDLGGHYAKEKIEKLAKFGIAIPEQTEFAPDSAITQKELIAFMLMAFEGERNIKLSTDEDVQYIYRRALRQGYITADEKSPDSHVLRGTAAKIIIRALGYSEVAELNGIFTSPFIDSNELTGHLSLVYAMNIAKGDGSGYFHPGRNITKAECAVMIYNYLSR